MPRCTGDWLSRGIAHISVTRDCACHDKRLGWKSDASAKARYWICSSFYLSLLMWGNNYDSPLSDVEKLQNKVVQIINDVHIRDHLTPHCINLGLLRFSDIIQLHTCVFLYGSINMKSSNPTFPSISEQHDYSTRSSSVDLLQIPPFRIIVQKFCPIVITVFLEWHFAFYSNCTKQETFEERSVQIIFFAMLK